VKNKVKIFFFLLLISFCLNAQKKRIVYEAFLNDKEDAKLHSSLIQDLEKKLKITSFNLLIDTDKSFFEIKPDSIIEEENVESILMMANMMGNACFRTKNAPFSLIEKPKIYLKDSTRTVWTITKESKYIGNFLCYKATANLEKFNYGEFHYSYPVIAWFAKELGFSFGPNGFGGLPGLILELEQVFFTFKMVKVENCLKEFPKLNDKPILNISEYYDTLGY